MNNFSEHKAVQNDDGTYTILDVPIFELGEHKGYDYTEEWADETIKNHAKLKEKKRMPRLIIGHSTEETEKKAFGFLDNIKKAGKQIIADLINIKEDVFNSIKDLELPGRSVEVNPEKKKFTALALLGGSEPYFENLEPIEIAEFETDDEAIWISFEDAGIQQTIKKRVAQHEKDSELNDVWWTGKDMIDIIARDPDLSSDEKKKKANKLLTEMITILKTKGEALINSFKEKGKITMKTYTEDEHKALLENAKTGFSEEFINKFKEEHGVTPEDALRQMKENGDKLRKMAEDTRKGKIKSFCDSLKEKGFAPALVDAYGKIRPNISDSEKVAKFSDEGNELSAGEFMDEFVGAVFQAAKDGKLIVPQGEDGERDVEDPENKSIAYSDDMSEDEANKFHKQVLKFQEANKVENYEDAVFQYLESLKK